MDMQLVFAGHTVDLSDRIVPVQLIRDRPQAAWGRFNFKIAGYRAADLLGVDHGGIFLNNTFLLQGLNSGFDCHSGNADLLPDVGIGYAGIFDQQPYNFLVQFVQSVQIHSVSSRVGDVFPL